MNILGVGILMVLLVGCGSGLTLKPNGNFYQLESGTTNAFRPSLTTMTTFMCVPEEGVQQQIRVDEDVAECAGRFQVLNTNYGSQPGALTGVFGAMIQGGAIVGGAYLLGDGIRDSADKTSVNQTGGGANSSSGALAGASASSNANTRPTHACTPKPKPRCPAFLRVTSKRSGSSQRRGSRLAAANISPQRVPSGIR